MRVALGFVWSCVVCLAAPGWLGIPWGSDSLAALELLPSKARLLKRKDMVVFDGIPSKVVVRGTNPVSDRLYLLFLADSFHEAIAPMPNSSLEQFRRAERELASNYGEPSGRFGSAVGDTRGTLWDVKDRGVRVVLYRAGSGDLAGPGDLWLSFSNPGAGSSVARKRLSGLLRLPGPHDVNLRVELVEPVESKEMLLENETIRVCWAFSAKQIGFSLTNKSGDVMTVDWDRMSYVSPTGAASRPWCKW